jgi:hypothetical protein
MINCLQDEEFLITGSASFDLPNYTPQDIDICILCTNALDHYPALAHKLEICAHAMKIMIEWEGPYRIPFNWGGKTFDRGKIAQYDVFLVDKKTFNVIKQVTECMKHQPQIVKEKLAKDKIFRVNLFQLFAQNFINK